MARIAPGLRDQLPEPLETDASQEPNGARFRFYEGVNSFLKNVSNATPLVVVLDDLHWEDNATLQLLAHAAHELRRAHVLIVCAYRGREIDLGGPLSEAVAKLARSEGSLTVQLGGLSGSEVGQYLEASAGVQPASELVEALFELTEGNLFFLHEIVALMMYSGEAQTIPDGLPSGVRAAIGQRLGRVSE